MAFSGVVYYVSLLISISLGSYYRKIVDIDVKRNYGTGLGLLLVCLICGTYIVHSILMVWGNIVIIKCCDRRLVFSYGHRQQILIYKSMTYVDWFWHKL